MLWGLRQPRTPFATPTRSRCYSICFRIGTNDQLRPELTTAIKYMQESCRIFDLNEVADRMGKNQSYARRLVYSGALRPIAGSRRLMISETELQRFISTTEPYKPRRGPNKGKKGVTK
jgi:hypothetical protein